MHAFSKHADYVCLSKGQTSVVLSSIFLPQSSTKCLFHDTSGGTFRIIIAYQESIIASFEDIWQSKLSQNVDIDVDHDNSRTVLLQTPNTSHSYPF